MFWRAMRLTDIMDSGFKNFFPLLGPKNSVEYRLRMKVAY